MQEKALKERKKQLFSNFEASDLGEEQIFSPEMFSKS